MTQSPYPTAKWGKARKKPVVVAFREPIPNEVIATSDPNNTNSFIAVPAEKINTREGTLYGYPGRDLIIKGVRGEIYPIGIDIFDETYDVVEPIRGSPTSTRKGGIS